MRGGATWDVQITHMGGASSSDSPILQQEAVCTRWPFMHPTFTRIVKQSERVCASFATPVIIHPSTTILPELKS